MESILFVDWENFRKKSEAILEIEKETDKFSWHEYSFNTLFDKVLKGIEVDHKIFYAARLKFCPKTAKKSKELIEKQRLLKTYLERSGFGFVYAGRVRENFKQGKKKPVFKEKGVDVKIAVDMIMMAFRGKLKRIVLASSDSDLQPAIKGIREIEKLIKQKIEIVYLGFEVGHNRGLSYTADRTILIRNFEILEFISNKLL